MQYEGEVLAGRCGAAACEDEEGNLRPLGAGNLRQGVADHRIARRTVADRKAGNTVRAGKVTQEPVAHVTTSARHVAQIEDHGIGPFQKRERGAGCRERLRPLVKPADFDVANVAFQSLSSHHAEVVPAPLRQEGRGWLGLVGVGWCARGAGAGRRQAAASGMLGREVRRVPHTEVKVAVDAAEVAGESFGECGGREQPIVGTPGAAIPARGTDDPAGTGSTLKGREWPPEATAPGGGTAAAGPPAGDSVWATARAATSRAAQASVWAAGTGDTVASRVCGAGLELYTILHT